MLKLSVHQAVTKIRKEMKKKRWGFTLIELIIVIVIIGILAVIAIPKYFTNIDKARKAEALSTMGAIREAEQACWAAKSNYDALPIIVDIDKDGTNDIVMVEPKSSSFTYSIDGAGNKQNYVKAQCIAPNTISYAMCIGSGEVATVVNGGTATIVCDNG